MKDTKIHSDIRHDAASRFQHQEKGRNDFNELSYPRILDNGQYTLRKIIESNASLKSDLYYSRKEIDRNGNIYSVDMVRINADISRNRLDNLVRYLAHINGVTAVVDYFERYQSLQYRHLFTVRFESGGLIKMGFHMNGVKYENSDNGFIEYNPNSIRGESVHWDVIRRLMSFFPLANLARFDLAIDIPHSRNEIFLQKDSRIYQAYRKSSIDFTETLGRRSHIGRVKLYNKQIESNLSYPLTRLEITASSEKIDLPRVFHIPAMPKSISDEIFVRACMMSVSPTLILSDLSPFKRNKMLDYLAPYEMHFDKRCIDAITESASTIAAGSHTFNYKEENNV